MKEQTTEIWKDYERGQEFFRRTGLVEKCRECVHFVTGDQWYGQEVGAERPASLNILHPIMKNATALVGQNSMSIHYNSMNFGPGRETLLGVCEKLNQLSCRTWEKLKMDRIQWDVLEDAFVTGDAFLYFYEEGGEIRLEAVDSTNVMLADEQNPDLQSQPYLLIIQRRYVEDVKREARQNGLSPSEIQRIVPDREDQTGLSEDREVENDLKCISVMKLWKEDGAVMVARAVKNLTYQPPTPIGLTLYPLAKYSWKLRRGSARGEGDVYDKIPNQIAINRNLYRFEEAVKTHAYPHKVYRKDAFTPEEVEKLSYPDAAIAVEDPMGTGISSVVAYLQPAAISPYAKEIWEELLSLTRQLSSAGDEIENVDPEKASGAAIIAARETRAMNLNAQVAAFKQFMEDVALIWYDIWSAYYPRGLTVLWRTEEGEEMLEHIGNEELKALKIDVRIDVSPNTTYSKLSQDLSLKELFEQGAITFEEFVEVLDDDSAMPKGKLREIAQKRALREENLLRETLAQKEEELALLRRQRETGALAEEKLIQLTKAMEG